MTTTQITITQALKELKVLDNRIKSRLEAKDTFIVFMTNASSLPAGYTSTDKLEADIKASYQSLRALIDRRAAIKQAIVKSNALTNVKIGRREMTVAEALEFKSSIEYKLELGKQLNKQLTTVEGQKNIAEQRVTQRLDDIQKSPDSTVDVDKFLLNNKPVVIDPLGVADLIQRLHSEIEDFQTNVDVALSVSNATTIIEV